MQLIAISSNVDNVENNSDLTFDGMLICWLCISKHFIANIPSSESIFINFGISAPINKW